MKSNDKSSWAVGGGLLCGLGVGLFYVKVNIFIFVGCMLLDWVWACFSQRSYLDHAGVAAKMLNVAPVAKMANAIVKNHR